ncbi:hypothetical protein T4D_1095 [Trichinella pseudospiralis]|uniref:Uncharacterized protein n=1 Tax=Trichinella pseudospiralis TaxID=6337 RepID=A0A0V1G5C6_TRIPS|nr:hypothetical protein T4D_1095 [Trichinella pseudospiralis]
MNSQLKYREFTSYILICLLIATVIWPFYLNKQSQNCTGAFHCDVMILVCITVHIRGLLDFGDLQLFNLFFLSIESYIECYF